MQGFFTLTFATIAYSGKYFDLDGLKQVWLSPFQDKIMTLTVWNWYGNGFIMRGFWPWRFTTGLIIAFSGESFDTDGLKQITITLLGEGFDLDDLGQVSKSLYQDGLEQVLQSLYQTRVWYRQLLNRAKVLTNLSHKFDCRLTFWEFDLDEIRTHVWQSLKRSNVLTLPSLGHTRCQINSFRSV